MCLLLINNRLRYKLRPVMILYKYPENKPHIGMNRHIFY